MLNLRKSIQLGLAIAALAMSTHGNANTSASANGTAVIEVVANLQILAGNNLDFGLANPGSSSTTVAPTDPTAGDFLVSGEPNRAYNITLPADGVVVMKKGAGGSPQTEVPVNSFVSDPAATGTLAGNGQQTLKVGATRAALDPAQESGLYVATYTVTVAY